LGPRELPGSLLRMARLVESARSTSSGRQLGAQTQYDQSPRVMGGVETKGAGVFVLRPGARRLRVLVPEVGAGTVLSNHRELSLPGR
jgi:hypothetical protein